MRSHPITEQPRSNAALTTPSRMLAEVPPELDRISDLRSIIFRPSRQFGCSPREFDILEDRDYRRIFRGMPLHGFFSCEYPGICIVNLADTREILQLQIDPHNCCASTLVSDGKINMIMHFKRWERFHLHLEILLAEPSTIHNGGWFSENFEMLDTSGNTMFLCDPRHRWNNRIPEFEITTTNLVSIGRITVNIHTTYGQELTLRWLDDDVSSPKRVLGLGFLLFLYLRIGDRYKNRVHLARRRRNSYDYQDYYD